jgi:Protein of unknown function (DUF2815)
MAKHAETPTSEKIYLHCRTRFLRLDVPKAFEEGQDPRWEATFVLDPADTKGAQSIATLLQTAAKLSKENYGVVPLAIKKLAAKFIPGTKKVDLNDPANADDGIKVAFIDGDADKYKDYPGYAGMLIVPAHNAKLKPAVANRKGLTVQPGEFQYPYDGCYALGAVTLWLQVGKTEQKYGRRVGVNLRGVQFAADGQSYSQDVIAAEDEFQALEDEEVATADSSAFD